MAKYVDIFNNFNFHPDTLRLMVKTDDRVISQSLRNLILTNRGEKPFEPNVGGNVRALLFDNFGPETTGHIRDLILEVAKQEPRAIVDEVEVIERETQNRIDITILFRTNITVEPQVLRISLSRVR